MQTERRLASAIAIIGMTAAGAYAQSVISAHSGTLHYFDGDVTIDGQAVQSKVGKFSEIKENSVLRTGLGRAEVLLTPGVFLRIGENSAVKMLDNRLASTRVDILSGSAMVESDDPEVSVKNPAVTILYKDYDMQPVKFGLFEIDGSANELKVYKGQANVTAGGNHTAVKEGRMMPFSAALLTEKFDDKQGDDLYLWTRDRSSYISAANMSSARTIASNGYGMNSLLSGGTGLGMGGYGSMGGYGMTGMNNGWYYNPYLSMFTYMPFAGTAWSPFGYGFYSPYTIGAFYSSSPYFWNGGGSARAGSSTGVPLTSIGTAGTGTQIARVGSGVSTHPTIGSPVQNVASASASRSGGPTAAVARASAGSGSGSTGRVSASRGGGRR